MDDERLEKMVLDGLNGYGRQRADGQLAELLEEQRKATAEADAARERAQATDRRVEAARERLRRITGGG